MASTLQHPTIGTIHGKARHGLVQYLGVPYASVEDRLAAPVLKTAYDRQPVDATKNGPQALSHPNACDFEHGLIQQALPRAEFDTSGLGCLHLNITVPESISGQKLPVLVFIHGGGFAVGSNAWPQYNQSRLVKLAVGLGLPFVGVSVNYRLGIPGFLTSKELRDAGYKSNNGLRDQRTALLWMKHNIQGFGGDPDRITLAGQSAGAVATMLQLQSSEPLFAQLLSLSGSPLVLPPLPPNETESSYSMAINALGLQELSAKELIQQLVHGPGAPLYQKIGPQTPLSPAIDDMAWAFPTYAALLAVGGKDKIVAELEGSKWCSRIMIGDCQHDGSIYRGIPESRKSCIAQAFHRLAQDTFTGSLAALAIFEQHYGLTATTLDDVAVENILNFLYHLNEPNPWDGVGKGQAIHIMDVVLLFHNFVEYLGVEQQAQGKRFAESVIRFISGHAPFTSCQDDEMGAMVYGPPAPPSGFVSSKLPADFGRRQAIHDLGEMVGYDVLKEMWFRFSSGQ